MKKLFEMNVKAVSFFGDQDLDENGAPKAEVARIVREIFYLPEEAVLAETLVQLTLKLEDFIWHLFTLVPQPTSPLKLAAHKHRMEKIAAELNKTLDKDELPTLPAEDLALIKKSIDDEEEFVKIQVPFTATPVAPESATVAPKAIPLPAMNLLRDMDFVDSLEKVFNG